MLQVPFDEIRGEHVEALIGEEETISLDFKRQTWQGKDYQGELAKDISAMANGQGGDIVVGFEEKEKDGRKYAGKIIPVPDVAKEVQRIEQLAHSHIAPRITGLRVKDVSCREGTSAIVVRVPQSLHAPHMVTYNDQNIFHIRLGRDCTRRMTAYQVRAACLRNRELYPASKEKLGYLATMSSPPDVWRAGLIAVPLGLRDGVVDITREDIRKMLAQSPSGTGNLPVVSNKDYVKPTLEGLRAHNPHYAWWAEIHRDGVLVAGNFTLHPSNDKSAVQGDHLLSTVEDFLRTMALLYEKIGLYSPTLLRFVIDKNPGVALDLDQRRCTMVPGAILYDYDGAGPKLQRTDVKIEKEVPDRFDLRSEVRDIADRMWNAWGLEQCPFFDADNKPFWEDTKAKARASQG